jgi:Ni,Fe-hydrogenase III small subunit
MSKWLLQGLRTGKKTTRYPDAAENAAGVSPGLPPPGLILPTRFCPAHIGAEDKGAKDVRSCVHCFRCVRSPEAGIDWRQGYEWAAATDPGTNGGRRLGAAFSRSAHIRVVDAGACGACLSEVKQTGKPHYNIHRLGFFITPTPRQADVLLVVGPVSDNMVSQLTKTYEAMPSPKMVVAAGTCALTGGVFGPGFSCRGGVADVIPVDVEVPGCPPPPLAIIHALLVALGRKQSVAIGQEGESPAKRRVP